MIEGTLLYFDPFVFKNGAAPKPNPYSSFHRTLKCRL